MRDHSTLDRRQTYERRHDIGVMCIVHYAAVINNNASKLTTIMIMTNDYDYDNDKLYSKLDCCGEVANYARYQYHDCAVSKLYMPFLSKVTRIYKNENAKGTCLYKVIFWTEFEMRISNPSLV